MSQDNKDPQRPNATPGADDTALNEDVDLTDDEQATLDEGTKTKIGTISFQKKRWRDKAKQAEADLEAYKTAHPAQPAPAAAPAPVAPTAKPNEQPTVDVDAAVRKARIEEVKQEHLDEIPEEQRKQVEDTFNSLTVGKTITTREVGDYVAAAARAVGVEPPRRTSVNRIISAGGGSTPPKGRPSPTKEQVEIARKMGNDPEKVYDEKKVDYSSMVGADRILSPGSTD
jgi:hypothetical protein